MAPRPIVPLHRPIADARVQVPASRSVANRELVLSAVAHGTSRLELGPLDPGDDVRAMRQAVSALGYRVDGDETGDVVVTGAGADVPFAEPTVNAGAGGTVARFAVALASLGPGQATVDGSPRLRERPIAPLLRALGELGARVEGDALPVKVSGPLAGGSVEVPGGQSSQFASALLLVAPRMAQGLRLRIAGAVVSAPYIEMTVEALAARGVRVERLGPWSFAVEGQRVRARNVVVPGDASAATYPAAAAAILGGAVTIENVDAIPRRGGQGDVRFFTLLEAMGCSVSRRGRTVTVRRNGTLHGLTADLRDCADVFPTLAVVAASASEPSEIGGVGHTRQHESDRIAAVSTGLRALGADVTEFADGLRIAPRPLRGGVVDAAEDHRVAMAFAILGLAVPGVAIEGADAVSKTFPDFFAMLAALAR